MVETGGSRRRGLQAGLPSGEDWADRTRPQPFPPASADQAVPSWQLVIAWHPRSEYCGAVARLGDDPAGLLIGRRNPVFTGPCGEALAIDDLHVSREACVLSMEGSGVRLTRREGSSRLRVNGRPVSGSVVLADDALHRGIRIALGDQVLLHLRRGVFAPTPASTSGSASAALDALLGVSAPMQALRRDIVEAARAGDDVLLVGPTGTGKELVARALHELGPRRAGPWVPVNMAAIPADLAAASFFGARRGAFTGADSHREGFFQRAEGGTLFLDEVGDAPASLQPLLLRALQEREVQVLGGSSQRVSLGIVAAMERDPDDPGLSFRQALRYRLAGRELRLPPLSERAEDIGLLASHFLQRRGCLGAEAALVPAVASRWLRFFEDLLANPWPGNVRELEHRIAQAAAAAGPDGPRPALTRSPAPLQIDVAAQPAGVVAEDLPQGVRGLGDLDESAFADAWQAAGYEVAEVARRYGVSRASVYRRLKTTRGCRLAADIPLAELEHALKDCGGDFIAMARRLRVSRRGLQTRLRAGAIEAAREPTDRSIGA